MPSSRSALLPTPRPPGPVSQSSRMFCLAVAISVLSACAYLPTFGSAKQSGGGHVIAVNDELWTIGFLADPTAGADSPVVAGEVLIQRRGQTVQKFDHSLSRKAARDDDGWLLVEDVNNDGLPDFLLTHAPAKSGAQPVKSLYLFDVQSQTFQLQKQISKLGDIDKLNACVVVTDASGDKAVPRTYCFSAEQPGWLEVKRTQNAAVGRCIVKSQTLAECRSLRTQRDEEMRRLVGNYIDTKSKSMAEQKRANAATRFARNLRVGHDQWLLYRDARCAAYVIEFNVPSSSSAFEMESCKLDLSSLQLQHYTTMLTSLDK